MKPRNNKFLVTCILLAAIAFGFTSLSLIARNHSQFWQGTAQTIDGLKKKGSRIEFLATIVPPAATDIHYYTDIHTHYYASFNVTEQEFLNWAAHIESTSIARNAAGQTIKKLRKVDYIHGFRPLYPESNLDVHGGVSFSTGYYTEVTRTTELMSVELAYDTEKERAYLQAKRN